MFLSQWYWIQYEDPLYEQLMYDVEQFLENPGAMDVTVRNVFTDQMFAELKALLASKDFSDLDIMEREFWNGGELCLAELGLLEGNRSLLQLCSWLPSYSFLFLITVFLLVQLRLLNPPNLINLGPMSVDLE